MLPLTERAFGPSPVAIPAPSPEYTSTWATPSHIDTGQHDFGHLADDLHQSDAVRRHPGAGKPGHIGTTSPNTIGAASGTGAISVSESYSRRDQLRHRVFPNSTTGTVNIRNNVVGSVAVSGPPRLRAISVASPLTGVGPSISTSLRTWLGAPQPLTRLRSVPPASLRSQRT